MDLNRVEPDNFHQVLQTTLNTLFSKDESYELMEGLLLELDEGSDLYEIVDQDEEIGFLIVTPLYDDVNGENIDLISIEDIFIRSGKHKREIADPLSLQFKQLSDIYNVPQIEIIIDQANSWIGDSLIEHGYISSEVKLEKLLPRSNNLNDVLELIRDCTPVDRIVQVLLEKDEVFQAEFLESVDEITDLLDEGWIPVMVVVTFEPDTSEIEEQIEESNQLINWDDYSIVYYG